MRQPQRYQQRRPDPRFGLPREEDIGRPATDDADRAARYHRTHPMVPEATIRGWLDAGMPERAVVLFLGVARRPGVALNQIETAAAEWLARGKGREGGGES